MPRSDGRKKESGYLEHLSPFPQTAYRCLQYLQSGHIIIQTSIRKIESLIVITTFLVEQIQRHGTQSDVQSGLRNRLQYRSNFWAWVYLNPNFDGGVSRKIKPKSQFQLVGRRRDGGIYLWDHLVAIGGDLPNFNIFLLVDCSCLCASQIVSLWRLARSKLTSSSRDVKTQFGERDIYTATELKAMLIIANWWLALVLILTE